jgi:hypothetical protein
MPRSFLQFSDSKSTGSLHLVNLFKSNTFLHKHLCYRCDIALRNISSIYKKHKEVRREKVNNLDSPLKVATCKNSCDMTNSSKKLVYVLPRSTIKITETSSSYLFALCGLGTSALSHPVH